MPACVHQPVMADQVLAALQPRPGRFYVDLTVGAGGHARRILEASAPDGRLLGIDRDPEILEIAREELRPFGGRARLVHGCFSELPRHLAGQGAQAVDGLLADLGVSSLQLDRPERGFTFAQRGPLDMRMDPGEGRSLAELLRGMGEEELAAAFAQVNVPRPRSLARRVLQAVREGRLEDTVALSALVGRGPKTGRVHPATQAFLALRLLVNRELQELEAVLQGLPAPLSVGGRAVFIAFHSLEDRAVKRRFDALAGACTCPPRLPECRCGRRQWMRPLSRKAVQPGPEELQRNPRARSARLRAAERVTRGDPRC